MFLLTITSSLRIFLIDYKTMLRMITLKKTTEPRCISSSRMMLEKFFTGEPNVVSDLLKEEGMSPDGRERWFPFHPGVRFAHVSPLAYL